MRAAIGVIINDDYIDDICNRTTILLSKLLLIITIQLS